MVDRKTAAKPAKQAPPAANELKITSAEEKAMGQAKARLTTRASINAAIVVQSYQGNIMGEGVDIPELVANMQGKFKRVKNGDLSEMEAMLVGQAIALQTMFTALAQRAAAQESLQPRTAYMSMALKAQAQSRATISALVDLKYPRQAATFVKQANISGGHQQVNNAAGLEQHPHAESLDTAPNKLLEVEHGTRMDNRTKAAPSRTNKKLATVDAIHRA